MKIKFTLPILAALILSSVAAAFAGEPIKKTRSDIFVSGKEAPYVTAPDGVRRQVLGFDGQVMMVKFDFNAGKVSDMHSHYHSQVGYVLSGKFEVNINGDKKVLEPGDTYYVEPDTPHNVTCLEAGQLLDVFSPMRQDFITK